MHFVAALPRPLLAPCLLGAGLALSGCAAGLAASAVSAAAQAATPERPYVGEDRRPAAIAACEGRAAELGRVHIIDADQRPDGRVTVWGLIENEARRSFECRYDGTVSAFKLRPIEGQ